MAADEKDRFIQYLVDKVNTYELDKRATELAVEEFQSTFDSVSASLESLKKEMEEIKAELREERSKLKKAEAKARKLDQQLKYAQKYKFGDKRQNARKDEKKDDSADREDEKDKFDGTEGTVSTKSVQENPKEENPVKVKKERDTSNRPEKYDTMSVDGAPVFHPTDDSKVPGYFPTEGHPEVVMKFEGTKATPEFLQTLAYEVYVKNVTFGLLHQWLTDMGMTISENTLHNQLKKGKKYLDKLIVVLKTIALEKDSIVNCDETWCKVRKYDHYKKCYIWVLVNKAEKIAIFFYEDGSRGRDVLTHFLGDAELKSIMTDGYNAYVFIGDELKSTKFKDTEHQICMVHAMAKLAKTETERTIRKLTTQRNNSLHYGSDEGVEMAVAYHSVISTVKLHGMSCWKYLGEFFKKICLIFNTRNDRALQSALNQTCALN